MSTRVVDNDSAKANRPEICFGASEAWQERRTRERNDDGNTETATPVHVPQLRG
jgi:hypothetical protein